MVVNQKSVLFIDCASLALWLASSRTTFLFGGFKYYTSRPVGGVV